MPICGIIPTKNKKKKQRPQEALSSRNGYTCTVATLISLYAPKWVLSIQNAKKRYLIIRSKIMFEGIVF